MKSVSMAALLALALSPLPGCRKAAVAGGSNEVDVPTLIKQLKDPDNGKRYAAAYALGQSGANAKAAVPALTEALRDSSASVRGYAAGALGQIGPAARPAVPALMEMLSSKDDAEAAAGALQALGEGGPAAARLTQIIKDATADPETRAGAVIGLEKAGDHKAAVALMISIIEDKAAVPEVRRAAAKAVGHMGYDRVEEAKAAVPALLANLDHPDVCRSGPWSLWALGATEPAVARLIGLLSHSDPQLRAEAASGLVHMAGGNPPPEAKAAVPALIQALQKKDAARLTVIAALGEIGPDAKEAVPALLPLLQDEDSFTRDRANDAIKKIAPNQ
jgi:HEAT repeat protein